MSHERDQVQEAMEDEMRELVEQEATKRPITRDEAAVILWHMGYSIRPENRA